MVLKKKLLKIINNYFPDANTDAKKWQEILNGSDNKFSTFHLLSSIEYYVSYFSDRDAVNLSIVLSDNQQAVGIFSLMAHRNKNNEWILSSNGTEIIEPVFKKSLENKIKKKIEKKILNLIFDISKELKIDKCQFTNMELFKLSGWYIKLLGLADETFTTYHHLINLDLSIEEIRLKFRKSFKPLVNKGLREWKVEVYEKVTQEMFEEFRLLHKSVAGKSTRSIESWNIQQKQINSEEAFFVTLKDSKNILAGAGLFTYCKEVGRYSVGVYKSKYKSLGHTVQMKAIETFKNKGLKWYEMGPKNLTIDKNSPSEKELSISFFLEGFATDLIARQHLLINMHN